MAKQNVVYIKKRNTTIDYMRGIAIFLVVLAHTNFNHIQYIELFHMAIFFSFSGYCYDDRYSENKKTVGCYFIKKLKSLYIPYISFNMFLLCLHNLFCRINIYTDNPGFTENPLLNTNYGKISIYTMNDFIYHTIKTLGFVDGEQLAGTLWFLRALFEVSIIYVLTDFIARKLNQFRNYFIFITAVFIMAVGCYLNLKKIHIVTGVEETCYYYIFFVIGVFLQKSKLKKIIIKPSVFWAILSSGGLGINYYIISHQKISAVTTHMPWFYVTNGLLGGILIFSISKILMRYSHTKWITYIGRNSLHIMLWHFLAFKIVSFAYIKLCGLPSYYLASFPVLKVDYLWIAYTVVGVAMPLGVTLLLHTLIKKLSISHNTAP